MFKLEKRPCNLCESICLLVFGYFCIAAVAFGPVVAYREQAAANRSFAVRMKLAKPTAYDKCNQCQSMLERGMPMSVVIRTHDSGTH